MIEIVISKDYSDTPGGRFEKEGPFSGERFRDEILLPKYDEALSKNEHLKIDLDGCYGFPSSFLEEAFGGLARLKQSYDILQIVDFIANDEPRLVDDIVKYVKEAF